MQGVLLEKSPRIRRRFPAFAVGLLGCLVLAGLPVRAAPGSPEPAGRAAQAGSFAPEPAVELSERHRDFLRSVEVLILPKEKEIFLGLRQDYQRDAFIRRFWKVRDPYPRTEQNELQERWESNVRQARQELGETSSERALTLIFFGEPNRRLPIHCTALRESVEIFFYDQGAEPIRQSFAVIFQGRGERARRWRPVDGIGMLVDPTRSIGRTDQELVELLELECGRSAELFSAIGQAIDVGQVREKGLWPTPSEEWVLAFAARTTDLPAGAEPLAARLELSFPGRNQSRTAVQGFFRVPRDQLAATKLGEHLFYNLIVDGEVLRQGELFESFRYRFDFPAETAPAEVPLIVQRYLRPGPYRLILRVEDAASSRMARSELEVQFVELYAAVVDRRGDFIEGLEAKDFTVSEDGAPQTLRRFEAIRDLPIRAGLVIDTSLSMESQLKDVEKAAYRFLETVIQPRDRAAVITFNDQPRLAVRFTSDQAVLAGGLAGLTAEGETALYDTLIYSLHYFSGISGKRTLVVLTDGADSRSTYTYEDALEFARRAGVAIYVIGLGLPSSQREVRGKMIRLAHETGGDAFFIESSNQLGRIYENIQIELRAQYLLAYQSSQSGDKNKDGFREVEVKVSRPGLAVKVMKGYFP